MSVRVPRSARVVAVVVAAALVAGACGTTTPSQPAFVADSPTVSPSASSASLPPTATPSPTATASPTPTPAPTPVLVPAPLDGLMVSPAAARRHPIAVMIDDLSPARPQSGFSAASIVWQAPAEGGIPRYMMIFGENRPTAVGPVRSARYYYIAWAAEWKAVYAHAGGSPQALTTLRAQGNGKLVYNADEFAWGSFFHRVTTRFAPHNLYTDGKQLDRLAQRLGAKAADYKPVWTFAPDAPLEARPVGGRISFAYPTSSIRYDYDRVTNTYLRTVSVEGKQKDAATKKRVAPKNVIVMLMQFGPLNDGHPNKHRLEAKVVGSGVAWISTNGRTIKGTWRKKSLTAPTMFYDAAGHEVTLTAGQTFINVMTTGTAVKIVKGAPAPTPGTSPSGVPSASPSAVGVDLRSAV
jgi:Protein of unknown function (DUF3048) N-terminal domain/Protein of unknown function (DUF3048) C-terminal domain